MLRTDSLRPVACCLLIAAALAGCQRQAPPAEPTGAGPAPAVAALTRLSTSDLRDKAQAALVANRAYSPAGDNAAEYLLALRDRGIATPADRQALAELEPFVVIAIDQSIERGDVVEATRLRTLLRQADSEAPALPRTGAAIAQLQATLADRARKAEAGAARLAAERTMPDQAAQASRPAPVPPATVAQRAAAAPDTAVASPVASVPMPASVVAAEPPRPVEPAPSVAPGRAPSAAASAAERRLVRDVAPVYPPEARARRLSGEVQVRVTIGPDGRVTDARTVESRPNGAFDRAALRAASRWVFEPGDGTATATRRLVFSPPGA